MISEFHKKMDRNLRLLKPIKYGSTNRKYCSETRDSIGLVYVSSHSNRKEKRNLIIDEYMFRPNGPTSKTNVYFGCVRAGCKARAIITAKNLEKMGNRPVLINNFHQHPSKLQLRLGRGGNQMTDDRTFDDDRIEEPLSEWEFVDLPFASQNSCSSVKSDPLRVFLDKMLNVNILTHYEKEKFEGLAFDTMNDGDNDVIYNTLQVIDDSKFGRGVISTVDVPKDAYIGNFFGRLCRKLPKDARYSYDIHEENEKPLFVNAENEMERPLLA